MSKAARKRSREKLDLLIVNAEELVTLSSGTQGPRTRKQMSEIGIIRDGGLAVKDGRIIAVGKTADVTRAFKAENVVSANGKIVLPGFVDPHTHLVFAGSLEDEFQSRIEETSSIENLKAGQDILRIVKETRKASFEKLVDNGTEKLDAMLEHGTTTVEAKSGYGLTTRDELRMLEVVQRLNQLHSVDVVATFLGAHAIPPEFFTNSQDYVKLIIDEMIPRVTEKRLAEFCDACCEKGMFTQEQTRRILTAGKNSGLRPKVHADQRSLLGGAELAASIEAVSADHMLFSSDKGIKAVADKGVIAVLLPAATFSLANNRYANARAMIDRGVPIALGTDFSPNCWVENQQFIIALACRFMKLTSAEAITATTINAAHAIGRANEVGNLEPGKKADIVVLNVPNHKFLGYRFGVNLVDKVIKNGRIVVDKEASRSEFRLLEEQKM